MDYSRSDDLPGVVPLDFWSGLFLDRGAGDGEWVLEARTWGDPPAQLIHEWRVRAAPAARQLDPTVQIPHPLHTREGTSTLT